MDGWMDIFSLWHFHNANSGYSKIKQAKVEVQ